jgi:uncharacterized membrane protein
MSNRRAALLFPLIGLTVLVYLLIAAATVYTGAFNDTGIAWNLVLAWIPFLLAVAVYDGFRRGANRTLLVAGGALWLLFFPNAPYLTTDLKYLRGLEGLPLKYEAVLISTAATVGLALGFASLYLMQAVVRRLLGAVNAWFFVVGTLVLSSFGVYLGRFERWNSWDVFTRPGTLLVDLWRAAADPSDHVQGIILAVLFTGFLGAGYLLFYSFARTAIQEPTRR